jgi:ABC-type amino acid transport substrate-binding protein
VAELEGVAELDGVAAAVFDGTIDALDDEESEALKVGVALEEGVLDTRLDTLLLEGRSELGVADDAVLENGVLDATELDGESPQSRS